MKRTAHIYIITFIIIAAAMLLAACGDKQPPNLVHSPDDIAGRTIGVLSGSPSAHLADELGIARYYSETSSLISSLKVGLLDCVIMEKTVAAELVGESSGVRILGDPLTEYDIRFAVAKENAELLTRINATLAQLEKNGTLPGLRGRYFARREYAYKPPTNVTPHPGSLTLAISPDDRPFSYKDDSGEFHGLSVEVAVAVCDYLGVGLQISEFDTGDLITAVWYGKADMSLGWLPDAAGDYVKISEPYANASHVVIVRT